MKIKPVIGKFRRRRSGATLVEVLIASTISVGVLGTLMSVFGLAAQEQRRQFVDSILQQEAANLQDQLTRLVRSMRQSESVAFGNPVIESGATVYHTVVMARGPAPTYPRESLTYTTNYALIYDPNRNTTGGEQTLFTNKTGAVLRKLYFFPSLKPGGIPDSTVLNIWLEMDDDGLARRRGPGGGMTNWTVSRSFTVTMRNL